MKSTRQRQLAQIHIARKELGMDEDTYRAMLQGVAGVDSSSKLDFDGMAKVLRHLRVSGFKPKNEGKSGTNEWSFVFKLTPDRQLYGKKIYRLAQRIGKDGQPVSKKYIEGIASQMAGATKPIEFCSPEDLHKIVQALEVHLRRLDA